MKGNGKFHLGAWNLIELQNDLVGIFFCDLNGSHLLVNNIFHKAFKLNGVRADGINITLITLLGRDLIWIIQKVVGYHLQLNYE